MTHDSSSSFPHGTLGPQKAQTRPFPLLTHGGQNDHHGHGPRHWETLLSVVPLKKLITSIFSPDFRISANELTFQAMA